MMDVNFTHNPATQIKTGNHVTPIGLVKTEPCTTKVFENIQCNVCGNNTLRTRRADSASVTPCSWAPNAPSSGIGLTIQNWK